MVCALILKVRNRIIPQWGWGGAGVLSFLVLIEVAEGKSILRNSGVSLCLMRYLGLLYNKKFTYLSLSYYAIVADLPSVIL